MFDYQNLCVYLQRLNLNIMNNIINYCVARSKRLAQTSPQLIGIYTETRV